MFLALGIRALDLAIAFFILKYLFILHFLFGRREISPKHFPRKLGKWLPGRVRLNATKGVSSVCEPLPPDRPLWFPGSSPPEWLDGR